MSPLLWVLTGSLVLALVSGVLIDFFDQNGPK